MDGQTVSHFRILRELGRGGMGEVYLAEDSKLERKVAIKFLPQELASNRERLARFRREAKAVAALNHPNIVTVYSVEEDQGRHFFAMEYVEGNNLEQIMPRRGLSLEQFFTYAIPLADALSAAHDRGITHRDLKPGNIMVNADGRIKVLDFGLAKFEPAGSAEVRSEASTELLTGEGQILGTMPFMSPEQLQGKPVDSRSDIFALGSIFYTMATGHRPFAGDSSADLISSILKDSPAEVTEIKRNLPRHLGRVISHCLEKDPEYRFQSALDVRNELEVLRKEVDAGKVRTSETSRFARRLGKARRSWLTAGVVAAVALVAVIALLLGRAMSPPSAGLDAVAVMPFANLTGKPELDPLSEGISAGLITKLSELKGIRLVGRSEAWSLPKRDLSPSQWGRNLGVTAIVEGEIQEEEGKIRVSVNLLDADTGVILWPGSYLTNADDLFQLQREMASDLATILSIPMSTKERARIAKSPTGSFQAYDYYLKGQKYLDETEDNQAPDFATENFRQSLRIDPDFALAHAGLSEALWHIYYRDVDRDALTEAEREAKRALELDPELPAAQVALARVYSSTGRQTDSIDELRKVLASHPKPEEAQLELAQSYERINEVAEAEKSFRAATALGVDDWFNWNALGSFLARQGRYDEAHAAFDRATDLAPTTVSIPQERLATLDLSRGRFDEAIQAYERIDKPIRNARLASNIGTAYYFSNRADKWPMVEQYYRLAVRLEPQNALRHANLADLYRRLGRETESLESYGRARSLVEERLKDSPEELQLQLELADYASKSDSCGDALALTSELETRLSPTGPNAHRLAYVYAVCGQKKEALDALGRAIALGESVEIIRQEDEFESLRDHPDFVDLTSGTAPQPSDLSP